jgi:hypothetical protein
MTPITTLQLLILVDFLRELIDQVSFNASADALQSFPMRDRQIKCADQLRIRLAAFRAELLSEPNS